MRKVRPSFFCYINAQNNEVYKAEGYVEAEIKYYEKNFKRNKLIIDFLLLLFGQTIVMIGFNIFFNYTHRFYPDLWSLDHVYNSHIGNQYFQYVLFTFIFLLLWGLIITPIIVKCFRAILGIRWLFLKFEQFNEDKDSYLDIYNNYVAVDASRVFFKGIPIRVDVNFHPNKEKRILSRESFKKFHYLYKAFIIILFGCSFLTISIDGRMYEVALILYLIIVISYIFSHIVAYTLWRKQA